MTENNGNEGQEGKEEPQNPAHRLLNRLKENKNSLHISWVHQDVKAAFIAFAEEQFRGDYGTALHWLMDDLPARDLKLVAANVEDHEMRLQELEGHMATAAKDTPAQPDNVRKMCDGSLRKVKK